MVNFGVVFLLPLNERIGMLLAFYSMLLDYTFPSSRVVDMVQRVIEWRGKPEEIRSDNGTKFIAKAFEGFCSYSGIKHIKIQKGKPMQNGYIERFNRTYREDVLNLHIFENTGQVKSKT